MILLQPDDTNRRAMSRNVLEENGESASVVQAAGSGRRCIAKKKTHLILVYVDIRVAWEAEIQRSRFILELDLPDVRGTRSVELAIKKPPKRTRVCTRLISVARGLRKEKQTNVRG
jgi:hypothetical protein